jgi:hypothetical protein
MSEAETATAIANIVLDRPYEDPDGDRAILSRQFLRSQERVAALEAEATLLGASLHKQEAEIERLKEALKPFADAADAHSLAIGHAVERRAVMADDCRRARSALSGQPGESA